MSEFKIYDLENVSIIFGGIPLDSGFGEGGAVKIAQEEPGFVNKVGSDGSVTRSKTGKKLTKVTITCLQTSSINSKLSVIHNIDLAAKNGAGVVPMLINDNGGLSLFAAQEAWIEGWPETPYNTDAGDHEWVIWCAKPERFVGGN